MNTSNRGKNSNKLWGNYLNGDERALVELIKIHHEEFMVFLIRLTKNRDDAGDLAQETWLKMMAHTGAIESFRSYLFRVASNLWIDTFTKGKRDIYNKGIQVEISASSDKVHVNPVIHDKSRVDHINHIIQSCLNERDWNLWRLHCEGLSSGEIAHELSIKKKTVQNMKSIIKSRIEIEVKKTFSNS